MLLPTTEKIMTRLQQFAPHGETVYCGIKIRYFLKLSPLADELFDQFTDVVVEAIGSASAEAASAGAKQGLEGLLGITEKHVVLIFWNMFSSLINKTSPKYIPFSHIRKLEYQKAPEKGIGSWFKNTVMKIHYLEKNKLRELKIIVEVAPKENTTQSFRFNQILLDKLKNNPSAAQNKQYVNRNKQTGTEKKTEQRTETNTKNTETGFGTLLIIIIGLMFGALVGQSIFGNWGIVAGAIVGVAIAMFIYSKIVTRK